MRANDHSNEPHHASHDTVAQGLGVVLAYANAILI